MNDLDLTATVMKFVECSGNAQAAVKTALMAVMTAADTSGADFLIAFEEATAEYFGAG